MAKRRNFTPEFKTELVLEVLSGATSQAKVCRCHNLTENQLSQWKRQLLENSPMLFASTAKQSSEVSEKRIAHLEQLVGRMAVALDLPKKTIDRVGLMLSEKRCFISAVQQEHSVRDICSILGINRSSFYYQPREDPSQEGLRAEIEKLAGAYPRYGYRRITQLLLRHGYSVGTRRGARLMKEMNLWVSVKRAGQTTKSLQGEKPWSNLLETLEVSHQDQVWVADITYVRLKGRFIYVSLLMDVFTRVIRAWQISQHLSYSLMLKLLEGALCHSVPEIHYSDQGVQYLSNAYITTLQGHSVEISVAQRGCPWENGYAERLIRTLKGEEVNINEYQSITEARDRIGHFIRHVYNLKRPHSALGYLTPMEFQRQNLS